MKLAYWFGGFLCGMLAFLVMPEPYPDPSFFPRRLPKREPVYGLKLKNGENHPVFAKDAHGFLWVDQNSDCMECHKGRWTQTSGPGYPMRLEWFRYPPNGKWDGIAYPEQPKE